MKIKQAKFLLVVAFILVTIQPIPASAISETITINPGYYLYYSMNLAANVKIILSWEITKGPSLEVYILSHEEYTKFHNGEYFSYYTKSTESSGSIEFLTTERGTYYTILYNNAYTSSTVNVNLSTSTNLDNLLSVLSLAGSIIGLGLLGVFIYVIKRSER